MFAPEGSASRASPAKAFLVASVCTTRPLSLRFLWRLGGSSSPRPSPAGNLGGCSPSSPPPARAGWSRRVGKHQERSSPAPKKGTQQDWKPASAHLRGQTGGDQLWWDNLPPGSDDGSIPTHPLSPSSSSPLASWLLWALSTCPDVMLSQSQLRAL